MSAHRNGSSGRLEREPAHVAVVYESDDGLRSGAGPFLQTGLGRGEVVLAVVSSRSQRALRSVLDDDGERVLWREPALASRRMSEVFEECRGFLAERHAAQEPARLLTENDLDTDPEPARLAAYLRFEAASTAVFGSYGYPWMCLYDRRRHPRLLVEHAGEVHPHLIGDGGLPVPSTRYAEPAAYLRAHPGPLSPVPAQVGLDVRFTTAADLPAVRHRLRRYVASVGHGGDAVDHIVVAAHEVIGNALRHGRPPCRVRAWAFADVLRVRVDDQGDDGRGVAVAGYRPPPSPTSPGIGLWVARQLADVVHTRTGRGTGTAVELQFR
jgi:anti-sigma regulatory factor (Ser/Thr protein kinase)